MPRSTVAVSASAKCQRINVSLHTAPYEVSLCLCDASCCVAVTVLKDIGSEEKCSVQTVGLVIGKERKGKEE